MKQKELNKILAGHKEWLVDSGKGERANLQGANMDFSSGIPFSCKGTNIKGGDRLFAQMIYHVTRQDWKVSKENQEFLDTIPESILNSFLNYRSDLTSLTKGENK